MSVSALALLLAACGGDTEAPVETSSATPEAEMTEATPEATETPEAVSMTLDDIVVGDWRDPANIERNQYRNPVETLEFFGVEPDDAVLEVWPGGGWYTEVLAPYLKDEGQYYAAMVDPSSAFGERAMTMFENNFLSHPDVYGDIETVILGRDSEPMFAEGSLDYVLTFRNVHNWMAGEYADKMFQDMYDALKPGGILGVVEHRLNSAETQAPGAPTGYVHEDYVQQLATAAGFVFVEGSEVNANEADTKDHPGGVWNLPPNLRTTDANGDEIADYDASYFSDIGESDRMTLMFKKPTAEELAEMQAAAEEETEE
ncbi:MAG: hypothetical protein CMK07_15300 [Ponticaulis sp.]|nr:hypothetical protein [Ponticaulis sp.]